MTQKESLYIEFVTVNNWIVDNLLEGKDWPGVIYRIDLDKMLRICAYRDYTIKALKNKIEILHCRKKEIEAKQKLENFYSTEHGQKINKMLTKKETYYSEQINFLFEQFEKKIDKLVKELIGKNYKVRSFKTSQIEIIQIDENGKEVLGHSFDINECDGIFMINYPTFGQFNPITNYARIDYLRALVKLTDIENFIKITGEYKEFLTSLENTRNKLAEVRKLQKNPYEL